MKLTSFRRSRRAGGASIPKPRFRAARPSIELLEDRINPSQTITVAGLTLVASNGFTSITENGATIQETVGGQVQLGFTTGTTNTFVQLVYIDLTYLGSSDEGTLDVTTTPASGTTTHALTFNNASLAVTSTSSNLVVWTSSSAANAISTTVETLTSTDGTTLTQPSSNAPTFTVGFFPFEATSLTLNNPGNNAQPQSELQGSIDFDAILNDPTTNLPNASITGLGNYITVDSVAGIAVLGGGFGVSATAGMLIKDLPFTNSGLSVNYSSNTWTISGTASISSQPQNSPSQTAFSGVNATATFALSNGALTDITLDVNAGFDLFGASVTTQNLDFEYDFANNEFTASGVLAVSLPPNAGTIQVTLQSASNPSDPGLVIQNGQVTLLNAVTTTNLTFFGATFETDSGGMTFEYDSTNEQYVIFGGMSLVVDGTTLFDLTLGSGPSDAGILVENGVLTQLNGTITSSKFSVGPLSWQVRSAQMDYTSDNGNDVFVISGDFLFQELWTVEVVLGNSTSGTNSGLIIDNGVLSINAFSVTVTNVNVGFLVLQNLDITYALDTSTGDYNLDLDGNVYFPQSNVAVAASFIFDTTTDAVTYFAFSVSGDITLGDSGLEIVYGSLTVQNPNSITNMVVTGTVYVQTLASTNIDGDEDALVAATGTVTISAQEFELSGTVYMGANNSAGSGQQPNYSGDLGTLSGSVSLDWASHTYQASIKGSLYDDTFSFSATFDFSNAAPGYFLYISATAKVSFPKAVPFIGGTTIGSCSFVFDYQGSDPDNDNEPLGYVAAWVDVSYLVGHTKVGFLLDINDKTVSDPKLIGSHTINSIENDTYKPATTYYSYSQSFSVPTGANITDLEVSWPTNIGGSQFAGWEFVPTGSSFNSDDIITESDYSSSNGSSLLTSPSGPYATATRLTEIDIPTTQGTGTYYYYLYSSEPISNTNAIIWQMTYAIPDPTISIDTTLPSGNYTSPTINVDVAYSVGSGLGSQINIALYAQSTNPATAGDNGFQVASYSGTSSTADSGTVTLTWNLADLPYQSYYLYASLSDGSNESIYSASTTTTSFQPTGAISGYVLDSINGGGVTGVQVYLDVDDDGTYDPAVDPVWTTNAAGYYRFDYSNLAQTTTLVSGTTYSVGLVPINSTTEVSLSSSFNLAGIYANGSTFASDAGLDGDGFAYSSDLLGDSLTWNGTPFIFGSAGVDDVVSSLGQSLALAQSQWTSLQILATSVDGSQPKQTFVINYTDGSSQSFTQSISDWAQPQDYSGESIALTMPYRNEYNGTQQFLSINVYGYSLALDSSKTVESITLPDNEQIKILAFTLVGQSVAPLSITSPNVFGSGTTFSILVNTSVEGTVFSDTNQTGQLSSSDPGLAGWEVYADLNNNGILDPGEPHAVSQSDGSYRIFNLAASTTYTIRLNFIVQTDYFTTSPTALTVTTDTDQYELITGQNFGALQFATITGTINNYSLDTSTGLLSNTPAPPPADWVVDLLDSDGKIVAATVASTSDGSYTFSRIKPGAYTVQQFPQNGWVQTSPLTATYNWIGSHFDIPVVPVAMVYGDFDGDGDNDIAVASQNGDNGATITFYSNDGSGQFSAVDVFNENTSTTVSGLSFDFDHSGITYDLITLTGVPSAQQLSLGVVATSGRMYVIRNDTTSTGQMRFYIFTTVWANVGDVNNIWGYGTGDFNNDGITDLAQSFTANGNNDNGLATYLMPAVEFVNADFDFEQVGKVAVQDVNLDGNADIVWQAGHNSDRNYYQVLFGNGDGTFQTPQEYDLNTGTSGLEFDNPNSPISGPEPVAIGDFNGDGLPDFAQGYYNSGPKNWGFQLWEQDDTNGFELIDPSDWIDTMSTSVNPFGLSFQNFLGATYNQLVWVINQNTISGDSAVANVYILGDGNADLATEAESGATFQKLGIAGTPISVQYFDINGSGLNSIVIAENVNGSGAVLVYNNQAKRTTTVSITAASGDNAGPTFYNDETGQVSGTIYNDNNLDDIAQPGDLGLGSVQVFLDANGNNLLDPGEISTLTNAQGGYSFTNIPNGTYQVAVVLPNGYVRNANHQESAPFVIDNNATSAAISSGDKGAGTPRVAAGTTVASPTLPSIDLGIRQGIDVVEFTNTVYAGGNFVLNLNSTYAQVQNIDTGGILSKEISKFVSSITINASNFVADNITINLLDATNIPGGIFVSGGRDGADGQSILHINAPSTDAIVSYSQDSITLANGLVISWTDNLGGVQIEIGSADAPQALDVTQLYERVLLREPDSSGLDYWTTQMEDGASNLTLAVGFWDSTEYRNIEVEQDYQTYLNRAPTSSELNQWTEALESGASDEVQVAVALLTSAEYIATHPTNTLYINGLYEDILGRMPSAQEQAVWLNEFAEGATNAQVATSILTSEEAYQDLVNSYYETFLDRPADPNGEANWVQQLESGQMSEAQVGQQIIASGEFFAQPLVNYNVVFITNLYERVLDRAPAPPELSSWMTQMQAGATPAYLSQQFWQSQEHRTIQVNQDYATYLQQPPDPQGQQYWVNQFLAGASEDEVAEGFLTSQAYTQAHPTNNDYVVGLYNDILGRSPENGEDDIWLLDLANGESRQAVAASFLYTQEALTDLLNSYYLDFLERAPDSGGESYWLSVLENLLATKAEVGEDFLASQEFFTDT